jgi:hypothetical protein
VPIADIRGAAKPTAVCSHPRRIDTDLGLIRPSIKLVCKLHVSDWISDPSLAALFQTLPGASFVVNGATPAKNSALTSAGAELRLANGVVLLAKFDGEFASHASTYAGTGTVRYTW